MEVENISTAAVALAAVGPAPSLLDNEGGVYTAKQVSGVPLCGQTLENGYMRPDNQNPDYAASSADFGMAQSGNKPVFPER
jgi:hypothetical protein